MGAGRAEVEESHSFYISSPFLGLVKERERVKELISRAGHAYRDSYGGSPEPVVATCQNDVRRADHYILLLAYRYGSLAQDGSGLSITELEFEAALQAGKAIHAFFLEFTSDLRNAFERDPDAQEALERFKTRVGGHCTPMLCADDPGSGATGQELFEQAIVRLAASPPPREGAAQAPPPSYSRADLDAWVEAHAAPIAHAFAQLPTVDERRVHVPLTLRLQSPGQRPQVLVLEPEHLLGAVEGSEAHLIVIAAEGGAGKTSLAVRIGFWALAGSLGPERRLPVLIDRALEENESVSERVRHWLEETLGRGSLDPVLVEALLRHKRLLPIVDHFSELPEAARQQVRQTLPPGLVLLTTRRSGTEGFSERAVTQITPLQISTDRLQSFFLEYLRDQGLDDRLDDNELVPAQNQLRRIVGNKPISVMLAQMFIDDVIAKRELGQGLLAGSVPELMLGYVSRLDSGTSPQHRRRAGLEISPALVQRSLQVLALASHQQSPEGRPLFLPLAFRRIRADQALAADPPEGLGMTSQRQRQALIDYLVEQRLLHHPGADLDELCFPLDPLSDYLAALRQRERLEGGEPWQPFLADLESRDHGEREGMRGFVLALRDACQDRLRRADGNTLLPRDLPDRLGRLADLDPEEERIRLEEQRAHKWLWELSVPVESERQDAIAKLAAMASPSASPSSRRAVQRLVTERLGQLLNDPELGVPERQDSATVLGMLATPAAVAALADALGEARNDPELRRSAAEALGLVPRDHVQNHDQELDAAATDPIDDVLLALLEEHGLRDESDPQRVDAELPLLFGAARGLQLRPARALPLLGTTAGLPQPMVTIGCRQGGVTTRVQPVPVWQLPLPEGEALDLVAVPAGVHELGSEPGEDGRDDYAVIFPECGGLDVEPLRRVELAGYAIGRFPITQGQWAAVARLEPDAPGHDLNPFPSAAQPSGLWSRFARPGCLPVDSVSWLDCQEWLRRLNRWLAEALPAPAPRLALPSESQWEAACRAGSRTPFHTGESLDPHWANFDGTYAYGPGRQGPFRQGPTPVGGMGLANAWGLSEMHGQLWEWCLDLWHPSPLDAPADGRAWEEPDPALAGNPKQDDRVLRGGCWCSDPRQCRSASRGGSSPIFRDTFVGFRVVGQVGSDAPPLRSGPSPRRRRKAP
jgi:formylglycine-generating enzyme required for sulfatase activity